VYWSGSPAGKERERFLKCAWRLNDSAIVADLVNWRKLGRGSGGKDHALPFTAATGPVHLKPLAGAANRAPRRRVA
jgi:hypothetical protein